MEGCMRGEHALHFMRDLPGDRALKLQSVADAALVTLGPHVSFVPDADQLRRDSQAPAATAHTAFQYITHVELAPDVMDALCGSFEQHAGRPRDHAQPRAAALAQLCRGLFSQPVAE